MRLLTLLLACTLLVGCDSAAPDLADTNDFSLRLGGAIQSDFIGDAVDSQAEARIYTMPDGTQELRLRLAAAHRGEDEELVTVEVVHQFGGPVVPGTYHIVDIESQGGATQTGLSYQFESPSLSSRYSARGQDLILEIVRVDADYLSGRLQVRSSEVTGYRKLHGQTEEVALAGRVDARAVFEAELAE